MRKIFAATVLSLFCVTAFADPCMDANVSALGYYESPADEIHPGTDEIHLDEHGC